MSVPVSELAGLQEDPLAEFVLAVIYTAAPVRRVVQKDTSDHWQWWARDPRESASFVWLTFAQPITDTTPIELEARVSAALAQLIPDLASSVDVSARVIRFDAVEFTVVITRPDGTTFDQTLVLEQGVPDGT